MALIEPHPNIQQLYGNEYNSYFVDELSEQFGDSTLEDNQISFDQLAQRFEQVAISPTLDFSQTMCPYCIQQNTVRYKQKEIKSKRWIQSRNLAKRIVRGKWINHHGYLSNVPINDEIKKHFFYLRSYRFTYSNIGQKTLYKVFTLLLKYPEIPVYTIEFLRQDGVHYIKPVNLETILNDHYGPLDVTSIPDQPIQQKHQYHDTCIDHTCPKCFRTKSSKKDICSMCVKFNKIATGSKNMNTMMM
jgi:hypothetical protein